VELLPQASTTLELPQLCFLPVLITAPDPGASLSCCPATGTALDL
jgi:hypothetical protein